MRETCEACQKLEPEMQALQERIVAEGGVEPQNAKDERENGREKMSSPQAQA